MNKKLIYAEKFGDKFWTVLLEKAYAKFYGSYKHLEGGVAHESFTDFTGGIVENFVPRKSSDDLFNVIRKALEGKSLIGTGINSRSYEDKKLQRKWDATGLYGSHQYTITQAVALPVQGQMVRLIRIRNPHGVGEWKGKFGDDCETWKSVDSEAKAEIGYLDKDNGEFFMSYDDFKKNFDDVDICYLSPDDFNTNFTNEYAKYCESLGQTKKHQKMWDFGLEKLPPIIVQVDAHDASKYSSLIVNLTRQNKVRTSDAISQFKIDVYEISSKKAEKGSITLEALEDLTPLNVSDFSGDRDIFNRFFVKAGFYAIVIRCRSNLSWFQSKCLVRVYIQNSIDPFGELQVSFDEEEEEENKDDADESEDKPYSTNKTKDDWISLETLLKNTKVQVSNKAICKK